MDVVCYHICHISNVLVNDIKIISSNIKHLF